MRIIDLDRFTSRMRASRETFAAAAPFPHLVIDDFLPEPVADALAAEFDDGSIAWRHLHHVNERKRVFGDRSRLGPAAGAVVDELHSPAFLGALEALTGISGLRGDPNLDGAGLQQTAPGGHLNVHVDALAHSKRRTWSRQLNLILFLNRDWDESYRGWLELWDARVERWVERIAPAFNRCVLFRTSATSFHGVPEGVACPPGRTRKSLALYYFREENRVVRLRPTRYVPRPLDPATRRVLIHADRALVAVYSLFKRYTPLDDVRATRLLRKL
jgi:hypothetical protein